MEPTSKKRGRPQSEPTTVVRIPTRLKLEVLSLVEGSSRVIPFYTSKVAAGLPSPADDYMDEGLDLGARLVQEPASTFAVRASGESMINAGIYDGTLLVVNRARKPKDNDIVIAVVNGDLTVKRMRTSNVDSAIWLCPENEMFKPLKVTEEMNMSIWGVVTTIINELH
jgi:DNA polymerase V